jgi:MFS family permease
MAVEGEVRDVEVDTATATATATAPVDEPGPAAASLWHDREFVKLWVGETVSMFGTQVTTLALPLTALLVLGISGDELGLVRFLQGVSFIVLPIPLGVWVDRRRHRPVLIGTNLVRAGLVGAVPVLAATGALGLPAVYLVALGAGICWVVFDVTWLSYIPAVVRDRRQLVEANGKLGVSFASAQVAGPGLAGLLVQVLTAPYALLFDAASYLVSAVSLLSIRRREPAPARTARAANTREDLAAGVRWVFGHRHLRVVVMIGTFHNFFTIWIQPVFLLFAVQTLALGPGLIGFVLSASAVGGILGAAVAPRLLKRWAFGRVYVTAVLAMLASRFLLPAASGPDAVAVAIAVVAFAVTNATMAAANVLGISLRQTVTPKPLMARMNAVMRTMTFGLGSFGAIAGGWVAERTGPRTALWCAAVGSVVTVLPLCFSSIRRLRSLSDVTGDASG